MAQQTQAIYQGGVTQMSKASFAAQRLYNDAHPFQQGRANPLGYTVAIWTVGVCCGLTALLTLVQLGLLVYSTCH